VISTLTIHWLGPPLFLPWCSQAKLAIWSERLAKGPYQNPASSEARTGNPQNANPSFLPLSYSGPYITNIIMRLNINKLKLKSMAPGYISHSGGVTFNV